MRLRQEQTVFLVTILFLGFLTWNLMSGGEASIRGGGRGKDAEFVNYAPPDVARALSDGSFKPALRREIFQPPRDTRPLQRLPLDEPPRTVISGLLPPTDPGPAPISYGTSLRSQVEPIELPEIFDAVSESAGFETDDAFLGVVKKDEPTRPRSLINPRDEGEKDPYADETSAERSARRQGYRRNYAWIQHSSGESWFGRIENENRYALKIDADRDNEPILFVRLNPDTGRGFFENIQVGAIPVERDAVVDFGFAETATNEFEVRLLELGPTLTRGTYDKAVALADECVRRRLEAPRALEIAEGIYRRAAAFDSEDPAPRLGLANCFEAGFRFEEAFNEYNDLLETFSHREVVHVRLARLEERFLLLDEAEQRLRRALSMDRSSWVTRYGLGSFLARRGRHAEAVGHLREANRNAPQDPNKLHIRVGIRSLLGDVLFALGKLKEAEPFYRQALAADPDHGRSRAGLLALGFTGDPAALSASSTTGEIAGEEGFEMLLARGIALLYEGTAASFSRAREVLESAAEADPLRADRALAALSFLAELTGHPDQALGFAEQSREINPRNAYALFQIGRLRGQQDDYEGAREALLAALEEELDFEDALVSLGEVAFRLGRFEDAERYFERAISLNSGRHKVHTLRGLNHLRLGAVADALVDFQAALDLDGDNPTAAGGLAWCTYLSGRSEQAVNLLASIDDRRRSEDKEDPWRVWSREQMERIQDHEEKVEWFDSFDRNRLLNEWRTREGDGPIVSMEEGAVKIEGTFTKSGGLARVYREWPASLFVSIEADIWIEPGKDNVRVGLFIARERRRGRESEIVAEASVMRHLEGGVQVRFLRSAREDDVRDMRQPFPTGRWVRLRIERTGEASESAVTITMDGVPLIEKEPMASLGSASTPLLVGLFAEGDNGREVRVKMENCAVVFRGAE
ncbi:MAG: hypothetical protein CMJ89_01380 [Planctomycetes bacterium]|jgi:tetratricopeptide (TPR) repeat protein|nr:hypothetical protein [Planctomycetota bacterium]